MMSISSMKGAMKDIGVKTVKKATPTKSTKTVVVAKPTTKPSKKSGKC